MDNRWRVGATRLAKVSVLATLLLCLGAAVATAQRSAVDQFYYESVYQEVIKDVEDLEIDFEYDTVHGCVNDPYAPNPCIRIVQKLRKFTQRYGLEFNRKSARILQSYARGDFRTADKLYAQAKGYQLPVPEKYKGPGLDVAAYGLNPDSAGENPCEPDPLAAKPCAEAVVAWQDFARNHGLRLDRQSAAMFEAYAAGDYRRGDHLYAAATSRPVFYRDTVHSGIGDEIANLGFRIDTAGETNCEPDPLSPKPCVEAVEAYKRFVQRHNLDANEQTTADLFVSYVVRDFVKADRLYAAAKGMTVATLLQQRGKEVPSHVKEPPPSRRLIVPIQPSQTT